MRRLSISLMLVMFIARLLDSQSLPPKGVTFPLPEPTSKNAVKVAVLPVPMRTAIQRDFHCAICNRIRVELVTLGALGAGAVVTQYDGDGNCGQARNCNSFFVLFKKGFAYRLEPFGGAADYEVVSGGGATPDLIGQTDMPCCNAGFSRYSFDGNHWVETGCESAEYTEGYDDPKHATITPC
jgi:hypothetical protein